METDEVRKARSLLQAVRARARWQPVTPEQRKAHAQMMAKARWEKKERHDAERR